MTAETSGSSRDLNRRVWPWLLAMLMLGAGGGCVGDGDGWVKGSLWVENCNEGEAYGEASKPADFDLQASFYAGEILEDSNKVPQQRQNRFTVRVQDTSNNPEASNGIVFQLLNLEQVARLVAKKEPVPVTSCDLCTAETCIGQQDLIRAKLFLFAICPNCQQPLTGSSVVVNRSTTTTTTRSGVCYQSEWKTTARCPTTRPACPTLTAADRSKLDGLCAGYFNDRSKEDTVRQIMGNGACIYFCQLGNLLAGQTNRELSGFRISYGDPVAAIFSLGIVDGRGAKTGACMRASGSLHGMFSFSVTRGRPAQSFP